VLSLSSTRDVLSALRTAQHVEAAAYTLHGPVLRALEAAARRGAEVRVELEGSPYDGPSGRLVAENRRVAVELRAAGASASLCHPLHAKVIAADGALYLDEKNWRDGDLVLRAGDAADDRAIPGDKREALDLEARLLASARAGDDAIVESETFGRSNVVFAALRDLAEQRESPRLLVSERELRADPRERAALQDLAAQGVRVRACPDSEKLAAVGDRAWLGSANATSPYGRGAMTDWGCTTADTTIVSAVRNRLERAWQNAKPLRPSA
jgi:hypothetical protein